MGQKPAEIVYGICELCNTEYAYKDKVVNRNRRFCSSTCARSHNGLSNKGRARTDKWKSWASQYFAGENNPFHGKTHTPEATARVAKANTGRPCKPEVKQLFSELYSGEGNPFYGKSHNDETRQRIKLHANSEEGRRVRRNNAIKKNAFYPNYNKDACELFDTINESMNWNGQHAENGGEFFIKELGYWVDYYEPTLNIVIEFDDKSHNLKSKKERDARRQKEIEEHLGCKFYRIPHNRKDEWKKILGF